MWSPAPPTVTEAPQIYSPGHISSVHTSPELPMLLEETLKAFPAAIIHTLPPYPSPFPEQPHDTVHRYAGRFIHAYLLHALHKARLIKTPEEIFLIRTANDISSRAHEVSRSASCGFHIPDPVFRLLCGCWGKAFEGLYTERMGGNRRCRENGLSKRKRKRRQSLSLAVGERGNYLHSFGVVELLCLTMPADSAVHQAYLPIVAASTRAATLHYCCNDKDFAWGPVTNGHAHSTDLVHDESRNLVPQGRSLIFPVSRLIRFYSFID
jgi:Xaa-Pro dipeptidase